MYSGYGAYSTFGSGYGAYPNYGSFYTPGYGGVYGTSYGSYGGAAGVPATSTMQAGSPYGAGGSYGSTDPLATYLRGSASVYGSQGLYQVNDEQAGLLREQRRQAQVQTRRRIFDEWQYERDNTPTLQDYRDRESKQSETRALTASPAEIWSGDSLNTLLRKVQQRAAPAGADFPLAADVVKQINFSTGSSSGGLGPVKKVKDGVPLAWPSALEQKDYDEDRRKLDGLLSEVVRSASTAGRVDAPSMRAVDAALERLRTRLNEHVGDVSPGEYIAANRFLTELRDASRVLQKSDVAKYFSSLDRGETVGDLVRVMSEKGLHFAPAASGDEAAYTALHRALAAYSSGLQGRAE